MCPKKKSAKRKRPSRGKRPDRTFKVLLASLFLVGFLVVSLGALTFLQRAPDPVKKPADSPPTSTAVAVAHQEPERLDQTAVQLEIERSLWRGGISFRDMAVQDESGVTHYHLPARYPGQSWYDALSSSLTQQSPGIGLKQGDTPGPQVMVSIGDAPRFILHFKAREKKQVQGRPKALIAIVVDDLGRDLRAMRNLLSIDLDLTMAVMPREPHTLETAELAHRAGREVLVHMPMEPDSFPRNDPGPGALLLGQDQTEIRERVADMFRNVPYAVGGNNHMGSRFTQYSEGMQAVIEVMKDSGWFFLDSRTSPQSVAFATARQAGLPAASRDIFLDNNQDVEAIARQLREAVKIARSRRRVIAICHPYPETVEALRREAAFLRQQDIEVVPVSRLLQR